MKKLISTLVLPFILINCSSQNDTINISGAWKITKYDAYMPDISPNLIESTRTDLLSSKYEFNSKNEFILTSKNFENGLIGVYKLDIVNKLITFIYNDKNFPNEVYELKQIDNENMIWHQDMPEIGYNTLTLKKIY